MLHLHLVVVICLSMLQILLFLRRCFIVVLYDRFKFISLFIGIIVSSLNHTPCHSLLLLLFPSFSETDVLLVNPLRSIQGQVVIVVMTVLVIMSQCLNHWRQELELVMVLQFHLLFLVHCRSLMLRLVIFVLIRLVVI